VFSEGRGTAAPGAHPVRVTITQGLQTLAELTLPESDLLIGSQKDCAICLADPAIPPQAVRIVPALPGRLLIENLVADQPISLNGQPMPPRAPLADGDTLTLLDYDILFRLREDAPGEDADLEEEVVEDAALSAADLARIKEFPLPPGSIVKRPLDTLTLIREQIDQCAAVGVGLAGCRDLHELIETVVDLLMERFGARAAWMGLRLQARGDLEIVGGRLSTGQSCPPNPVLQALQYRCAERNQHVCVRRVRDHEAVHSAMGVPLITRRGTLGLIYVDRRKDKHRFQVTDLDVLSVIGCMVSAKVEELLDRRAERSAQTSAAQVELIHQLQALLDPKPPTGLRGHLVAAYSRPGQERPGDVYDFARHPDSEIAGLLLGHVDSTGPALALGLARLQSAFRMGFLHRDPPHALARALNWFLTGEPDSPVVDALFLEVDPPTGKFRYSRAGRIGSFIVDARGQPRQVKGADGPALSRVKGYEYVSKIDQLGRGETLVLYTRGITTMTNARGERFSEKRFIEMMCDGFCQTPAATIQDIADEFAGFFADGRHPDDVTVILVHRQVE